MVRSRRPVWSERPTIGGVRTRGLTPRTDAELVADVRAGRAEAFDELYRAHVGAVRAVAVSHVRDADTVADIIQDTFARALQHLDGLREPDRFRPWLLSIARHAAVDQLRAGKRVITLDDERAEAIVSNDPRPDVVTELNELAQQVKGCVSGLSRRDATAVALVTQLGFTPDEVGAALGVKSGAAKVIVHRARRRMRHALMLELMVEQPDLGCAEFVHLSETDPALASRHLETCEDCIDSARAEMVSSRRGRRAGQHIQP